MRALIPASTAATFGAVAAIRLRSSSWPLRTYLSWHGRPNGFAVWHSVRISVKPMSLPPICSDTIRVSAAIESNCGGFVPA